MKFRVTQTAIIGDRRYAPLYLSSLDGPQWSGSVQDGLTFPSEEAKWIVGQLRVREPETPIPFWQRLLGQKRQRAVVQYFEYGVEPVVENQAPYLMRAQIGG